MNSQSPSARLRGSTLAAAVAFGWTGVVFGQLGEGYWGTDLSQPLLDNALEITLAPDLTALSGAELQAVQRLIEAGSILQSLYEDQMHPQALEAFETLNELVTTDSPMAIDNLQRLYRLFKGPIATTLENERLPFLPARAETPGKAVYPEGITAEEIDAFIAIRNDTGDLLEGRTVVRRATVANLREDIGSLQDYPVLGTLHPGLSERLARLVQSPDQSAIYAVPYSVAWAPSLLRVYDLLWEAADLLQATDSDFAAYLRLRARDLLSDDYEGGDAAWVTGTFGPLNAQIGSYETYDDALFGVKTFFGMNVLLRDRERSASLARALTNLQAIEDRLPYDAHRRVRTEIPVGVYHVIADFGQSRGANTATILPNDANHSRKYGRTILLRYNIMTNAAIFEQGRRRLAAATGPQFRDDLTLEGTFQRTLWHEVGHYLGVDVTRDGRDLDQALQQFADLFEEMKADLVSLYTASYLRDIGYLDTTELRSLHAGGILRVLQANQPRRSQPYQTMQLMQWNYYLENGLLEFDEASGRMQIHYELYDEVVGNLLTEVLAIQHEGDAGGAEAFVERWGHWDPELHGIIAANIRNAIQYRYYLVRYAVIDPPVH
ncbi:MAG TPA: NUDIX hydrolase [Gammaproteobacteria bacterium]